MRTTVFHAILDKTTLNELKGISQNPCIEIKQLSNQLPTTGYIPVTISITPSEGMSLASIIEQVYRANLSYNFKANSINFNISELPFQTYVGWLEPLDAERVIPTQSTKLLKELESLTIDLLNWHPEPRVRYFLSKQLEIIANNEKFDVDEFYSHLNKFTDMAGVNLDEKDLCRLYNQTLYIWRYMCSLDSGKDFVKILLVYEESARTLAKLRNA